MDSNQAIPVPDDLSGLHPFCRALFQHWDAARAGRFAPSWRALDLISVKPAAAVTHCTMVECIEGGAKFIYRFFGTWHVNLHSRDLTHQPIDTIRPASHAERIKAEYVQVIQQRRPLIFRFDVPILTGTRARREVIRLPLSDNGSDIGAILGATVFLEGEREALSYFRGHMRDST